MTYFLQGAFDGITWTNGAYQYPSIESATNACNTLFDHYNHSVTLRVKGWDDGIVYYRRNATARRPEVCDVPEVLF